jgi:hypothetical protein
MATSGA